MAKGKEFRVHLLQCACSQECALVSVLVEVLLISVYGCFAGRNLFESGRVCFFFPASPKLRGVFFGKAVPQGARMTH